MSLTLRDVGCVRGGRRLFAGVSVALGPGEVALVTGPNGVGKSSLMRIAAGLLAPAEGTVEVAGRVALLAEASGLDADRTVGQALRFWAAIDSAPVDAVPAALADVDLAALVDVPVRMLSTGQRRRIAMARVIASQADVWLLDEPANGLDMDAVVRLEMLVAQHRSRGGVAVIATHQPLRIDSAQPIALPGGEA